MSKPVVIVGAGPVGLSLALGLRKRNRDVIILDSNEGPQVDPRANTWHPRTLEMFAEWGVLDGLRQDAQIVEKIQYWDWDHRKLLLELNYRLIQKDTPYPFRLHLSQHEVCAQLVGALGALGVQVQYGHRVTGFDYEGDGVQVLVKTDDGTKEVFGSYLCGADGLNSTVRNQLDVVFEGATYKHRFLTFEMGYDFTPVGHAASEAVSYYLGNIRWALIMPMRDGLRTLMRLSPNDTREDLDEGDLRNEVYKLFDVDLQFKFRYSRIYTVHNRLVNRMQVGRYMLLGDAAHLVAPVAGTGVNSGIHDAYFLAKALDSALKGETAALAHWDVARRDAIQEHVALAADDAYYVLAASGPYHEQTRNRVLHDLIDPKQARRHMLRMSMLDDRI